MKKKKNGKYRFLEALLNTFMIDEIKITKKGYRQYYMKHLPSQLIRPKEQNEIFKNLLKNMTRGEDEFGKHWIFDESKVTYKPPFLNFE